MTLHELAEWSQVGVNYLLTFWVFALTMLVRLQQTKIKELERKNRDVEHG
jgi:hypothetical protein